MKRLKLRNARGDTIVEVLIVLAVLSLAFSISYATANHGLAQARNSEEHSEALGNLNTQVELVRTAVQKKLNGLTPYLTNGKSFCITSTDVTEASIAPISDPADTSTYPANCVQNGLYYQSVSYESAHSDYVFTTSWDGIGTLGKQTEQIAYRIQPLQTTSFSGIILAGSPARISVLVQEISPNSDNTTPSCDSSNALINRESTVTIRNVTHPADTANPPVQTQGTNSSTALFSNLHELDSYSVSDTAPANFQVCPSGASSGTAPTNYQAKPGITNPVNNVLKLRPVCWVNTWTTTETGVIHHHDLVNDYGWVYSSTTTRSPPTGNGYHWTSPLSPSQVAAIGPYPAYSSPGGGSGWDITQHEPVDSTHNRSGWYSYAGWFYLYVYDDWWDNFTYQQTGSHYNDWDETYTYTVPHSQNVCP